MTAMVDANILIAFALAGEPLHTQAGELLATWDVTGENLIAPRLFRSEIAAVMRKVVYQQQLTVEQGRVMLVRLLAYPVNYYEDTDLLKAAHELAVLFNRPRTYDTQYLVLAERFDCDFWTADERLFHAVQHRLPHVKWLGSFLAE